METEVQRYKNEAQLEIETRETLEKTHASKIDQMNEHHEKLKALMDKRIKENGYLEQENSEKHAENQRLVSRNVDLEAQFAVLTKRGNMAEAKFTRQKNETEKRDHDVHELLSRIDQMDYDAQMARNDFEVANKNNLYIIEKLK